MFAVKCDFMKQYEVRGPYNNYGGDAYFDDDGCLTRIVLHGEHTYKRYV